MLDLHKESLSTKRGTFETKISPEGQLVLVNIRTSGAKDKGAAPASIGQVAGFTHSLPVLVDCGAARTVVGKKWIDQQCPNWKEYTRPSQEVYRFGGGDIFPSLGKIILMLEPLDKTGKTGQLKIEADVVNGIVPLLISRPTLKTWGGIIDFGNNTLAMNGTKIRLIAEPTGHIRIPLKTAPELIHETNHKDDLTQLRPRQTLMMEDNMALTQEQLKKLHIQY